MVLLTRTGDFAIPENSPPILGTPLAILDVQSPLRRRRHSPRSALSNPPREDLATIVEQRLQEVENNLTPLENQLEKAQAIQAQYEQVMDSLEAKHASMVRQLRTLQSLTTSASAEERAAQAIHAAGNALGDNSSIDNITQRIQSRSDVAHARLQQAMGSVTPQPDPVADALEQSAMQQRIATRRARLGLPSAGGTTVNEVPNQ